MRGKRGLLTAVLTVAALAVIPGAASASTGLVADSYPATLQGTENSEGLYLTVGSGTMSCVGFGFEATLKAHTKVTTTSSVKDPSSCGAGSLKLNGCQIELDPAGSGSIGIGPPGCGPATFNMLGCKGFQLPAQSGISATYENVGSGSGAYVEIDIDDSSVTYVGDGFCSKSGTQTNLAIQGGVTVKATNAAKEAIGTSAIGGGLFVGGGSEGEFEAAEYPADVAGERFESPGYPGPIKILETAKAKMTCAAATYDGGQLSAPASEMTLDAAYSGCLAGANNATVSMNSCRYVYSGLDSVLSEDEYEATAEIACNTGDAIKVVVGNNLCTVSIPAQTLGGGQTMFGEFDVANEASLVGVMSASGVDYSHSEQFACKLLGLSPGAGEDGTLESAMLLQADFPG